MERNKSKRGITLIALIITIIVMLILVSVSVQIVINSGLFDSAKTAAKRTEEAYRTEGADGGKVNIDGEVYNSIEEYMERSCTHEWGEWQIKKGTWWETSRLTEFKNLLGGSSYRFWNNGAACESLKAAAGFYYNFGSLPFAQSTSDPSENNGTYTAITNSDQKNGTTAGTGAGLFLTNKASGVRLLTLKELNEARGITNNSDNYGAITAVQDPTGLYYLGNLKSVTGIGSISYNSCGYWLASPWPGDSQNVALVTSGGGVGNLNRQRVWCSSCSQDISVIVLHLQNLQTAHIILFLIHRLQE